MIYKKRSKTGNLLAAGQFCRRFPVVSHNDSDMIRAIKIAGGFMLIVANSGCSWAACMVH